MGSQVLVKNLSRDGEVVVKARWCQTALCRMRGLTFRRKLPPGEALLLVGRTEDRAEAGIHMFWVFFSLGVVWVDSQGRVVDCRIAKPWRAYLPKTPALYVLEGRPDILAFFKAGDQLEFEDVPRS